MSYVERRGVRDCEICGFPHVHYDPARRYRAIVVASEPLSHEEWRDIPDRSLYCLGEDLLLEVDSIGPI